MKNTVLALLVAALGAPSAALAAPKATELAEADYKAGVEAFKAKEYAKALPHFERAYKLDPVPILLYNLARCYEELGDFDKAIESYDLYLVRVPDAPDRKTVEARVRVMRIAQRRGVKAEADAQAEADAKAQAEAEMRAKAEAAARAKLAAEAHAKAEPAARPRLDLWGYGLMGVGAVGLIFGGGMGLAASSAADDHAAATTHADKEAFADDARSSETMANVGYVVGALLVAGGAGLVIWDRVQGEEGAPKASLMWTPGGAGLTLGGSF